MANTTEVLPTEPARMSTADTHAPGWRGPHDATHAQPADEVLQQLGTARSGLTPDEAARRLQQHGRNELPPPRRRHPLLRFLSQFHSALIYFLLAAAVAAWVLEHPIDAAVIFAVVVINALVGFIQEGKAEDALEAIRGMIAPHASVLRDGHRVGVPVAELVPGDLVLLEPGDRVPADLRLIRARGLLIDEAILTGESVAAIKSIDPVGAEAALGDRRSMAYSGTMVAAGQAVGAVVATGLATEIGKISTLIGGVQALATPLLRQINRFARQFTWVAFGGALLMFLFAVYVRRYEWTDALLAVVALAVSAIPEGLPAVITITLAIGVQRMAARNAVVRRLPAVETLGATSVICSDKTGTLTRNEMTVRRIVTAGDELLLAGSGYAPHGDEHVAEAVRDAPPGPGGVLAVVRAGLLCNDAHVRRVDGHWRVEGDPMEGALVTLAMKAGLDPDAMRAEWPRLDEIPFDAQHRFMATLVRDPLGVGVVLVKGAPERLLDMCTRQATSHGDAPLDREAWHERIATAAAEGERVLGFAMKPAADAIELDFADVDDGLLLLGIVSFIDPPRDEVIDAIAQCHSAGITVKMITGDHAATASAIARQLGLGDPPQVLTGHALDGIDEAGFAAAIDRTDVFARTSPEHKLRIVQALQSGGAIVAMTGDGVNDAPSLKQADIGIAMGRKGTEAAKDASQMVLLDDNFASIVAAVHEGRTVYDNIRKVVSWTLPTNGGEVLTVMAAILFAFTMPMSPVQILWLNMITSVTLGLALAFEPAEPGVMRRPPRPAGAGLLSPLLVWRIAFVSMVFAAAALGIFFFALSRGNDVETARTLVVNVMVVLEIFYLFNVRYLHMSSFTWRGVLGTRPVLIAVSVVVLAQIAFTYWPLMHTLFGTRPVDLADGALVIAIGAVAMVLFEGEKHLMRRLGWSH